MTLPRIASLRHTPCRLALAELPQPAPGRGEILVRVSACGICHTELDEIEGRAAPPVRPIVLGHEVGGRVAALGEGAGGHPTLPMEREIESVANITAAAISELLALAGAISPRPTVETYPLEDANRALRELREGPVRRAKVLLVDAQAGAA